MPNRYCPGAKTPEYVFPYLTEIYFLELATCAFKGRSRTYWIKELCNRTSHKTTRQTLGYYYKKFGERLCEKLKFDQDEEEVKEGMDELYVLILNGNHDESKLKYKKMVRILVSLSNQPVSQIRGTIIHNILDNRSNIARGIFKKNFYEEYARAVFLFLAAKKLGFDQMSDFSNESKVIDIAKLAAKKLLMDMEQNPFE